MSQDKQLDKAFRSDVDKIKNLLVANSENDNVILGTKEKPIVTDSPKIPIEHMFMEGVYVRKMTMFKGTAVVGAIHNHQHICFLLSGHLTVKTEDGLVDYIAPCYIVTPPGKQRVLYSHEDSEWFNIHSNPNNIEEISKLEKELVSTSYEQYEEYINKK